MERDLILGLMENECDFKIYLIYWLKLFRNVYSNRTQRKYVFLLTFLCMTALLSNSCQMFLANLIPLFLSRFFSYNTGVVSKIKDHLTQRGYCDESLLQQ